MQFKIPPNAAHLKPWDLVCVALLCLSQVAESYMYVHVHLETHPSSCTCIYMYNVFSPQEAGMVVRLSEAESLRLEQLLAQEDDHTEAEVRLDTVNMLC